MIIVWNHSSLGFGRSPIRIFPILQKIEVCPGTVETLKGWKYYIRDLEPQLEDPAQCIHQLSAVLKQMFGLKIPRPSHLYGTEWRRWTDESGRGEGGSCTHMMMCDQLEPLCFRCSSAPSPPFSGNLLHLTVIIASIIITIMYAMSPFIYLVLIVLICVNSVYLKVPT